MAHQELTLGNKKLTILYDSEPQNPREWDNLGTFIDTQGNGDETDFIFKGGYGSRQEFIEKGIKEICKHFKDVGVIMPVHKYQHSGVSYSTSYGYPYNCRWDSGTVGFIFATKQDIRENWGIKRVTEKYIEYTQKILSDEIDTFSQWANGDVFGFTIEENGEVIDSCYGFYGYDFINNGLIGHAGKEWTEIVKETCNL